jgi:hypothetical protein
MTKVKPAFTINPKPNHTGYQALGSVKGKFTYFEDQSGANKGKGILKTKYGDFPAYVHIKCRKLIDVLYSRSHYFLVWFRNAAPTASTKIQFTIVGCGSEGVDNKFLITGVLVGGNPEAKEYQFAIARNFNSSRPVKRILKYTTRNFRVRVSVKDDLWELYKHKLVALTCELEDGALQVVDHQLISEELPDKNILKSFRKKFKNNKNKKVIKVKPGQEKPLIKKKITVGVIEENKKPDVKVKPDPVVTPIVEPVKKKVLELPKK